MGRLLRLLHLVCLRRLWCLVRLLRWLVCLLCLVRRRLLGQLRLRLVLHRRLSLLLGSLVLVLRRLGLL